MEYALAVYDSIYYKYCIHIQAYGMLFRARRGAVYTTLTDRASRETVGVYMKDGDYRHYPWAGILDRAIAKTIVGARPVKLIMYEYSTSSDTLKANWIGIRDNQRLVGCAVPSTQSPYWVVFAVVDGQYPMVLKDENN